MKPGSRETIPTISEIVREATAICDPEGIDTAVIGFFESFEDDDPAALAAAAAAVWLATNPSQADNGDHVLREGVRLVFEGSPPEPLADWLAARGVEL